ncbi:hypothetical protein Acr_11g0017350 [Actinidia rufa]|uniref:Uncharacterized protein n=1 Tax=Actinidia rufa TaxID=165716 RepID=A0A7J0FGX6_9ERIC|nr:hypothetical protein Acr_11g0017350 [Actinidia rufa]
MLSSRIWVPECHERLVWEKATPWIEYPCHAQVTAFAHENGRVEEEMDEFVPRFLERSASGKQMVSERAQQGRRYQPRYSLGRDLSLATCDARVSPVLFPSWTYGNESATKLAGARDLPKPNEKLRGRRPSRSFEKLYSEGAGSIGAYS